MAKWDGSPVNGRALHLCFIILTPLRSLSPSPSDLRLIAAPLLALFLPRHFSNIHSVPRSSSVFIFSVEFFLYIKYR